MEHLNGTFIRAIGITRIYGKDKIWCCHIPINEMSTGEEREVKLEREFDKWISYRIYDYENSIALRFTPDIYNKKIKPN